MNEIVSLLTFTKEENDFIALSFPSLESKDLKARTGMKEINGWIKR